MLGNSENFYEFKDFITIKNFFEFFYLISLENPTIPDKIFGTKWSNPVKLGRKKKFGMCFCVFLTAIG